MFIAKFSPISGGGVKLQLTSSQNTRFMFLLEFHSAVFSFEELTEEQAAALTMD